MNRLLAIAAMLATIAGCNSRFSQDSQEAAPATAATAVRVTATAPVRKTLRRESVQPGQIEAFEYTPLFAKFPAYVQLLYVDIGDRVEANQLLVDLFLPELKDELHQKEAAVVQSGAEIELAVAAVQAAEAAVATASANVSVAEAGNIRAEADYVRWQSQYARISQLANNGSLDRKLQEETQNSLKAAEAARGEVQAKVTSAKAMLQESRANLEKAKANAAVGRARYENAVADMSRQKAILDYTQIHAPYAGVVTERNVNRGDFVQPASTTPAKALLAVARTDVVRVFVDVPEMESPWVEAGRTAYVAVQALPDQIVEGRVVRTSWVLGKNRTLRTELDFPNPDGLLRPGMYATAHILLQERTDVYVLPSSAILRDGGNAFCWTIQDGRLVRTSIRVGLRVGNDVEVISGVKPDSLVVQYPLTSFHAGMAVLVND